MSKRNEYAAKMKHQIDAMNQELDELERKAKKASGAAEKKYDEQVAKLRKQIKQASDKLDELKSSAESGWESMIDEIDNIVKAFRHSYNYLKSQL